MKGDVSPQLAAGTLLFTGYDDHKIRVNAEDYHSGLSIHAGVLTAPWGPDRLCNLTIEHLEAFINPTPEILILGTGRRTLFPNAAIMAHLAELHIGFECMDSRAAARTYNILVAEGRKVSAALLLPSTKK